MSKPFRPEDVTLIEFAQTRVALLEHRGDPATIGYSVRSFIAWRKQVGLHPGTSATFNIWHDDPRTTPPEQFCLELAAATEHEIAPNPLGIAASIVPGGRCAVLRHIGSEATLGSAGDWLCREWLPTSGEYSRDFPHDYRRFSEVAGHEMVIDLFLPLLPAIVSRHGASPE